VEVQYVGTVDQPPTITGQTPAPNATGVAPGSAITITFSEPIVAASANTTSITLKQGSTTVAGSVNYESSTRTVTFDPTSDLGPSTTYTVAVSTAIEDTAANTLASPVSWQFTTRQLALTASAGTGGSISPPGQVLVNYGSDLTFTITPDAGYYLSQLLVDGAPVTPILNYTFSSATTDHTIAATFKPVWYVDGSVSSAGNGKTWQTAFKTIQAAVTLQPRPGMTSGSRREHTLCPRKLRSVGRFLCTADLTVTRSCSINATGKPTRPLSMATRRQGVSLSAHRPG
jgi:hypothetical protein